MKLTQIAAVLFLGASITTPAFAQTGPGPGAGVGPGGNQGMIARGNQDNARGLSRSPYSTLCGQALATSLAALPIEALNSAEQDSLIYMREEEKLAHDVYVHMNTLWGGVPVFDNIADSEFTHAEAVRQLLARYSLPDPAATSAAGQFQNANLQALYTQLVATGTTSFTEALKVGATIEEMDIMDIQAALVNVDNQDIRLVYDNLLRGSQNHLRAFVKNLFWQDVIYTPQFMSPTDYEAIINNPMQRK